MEVVVVVVVWVVVESFLTFVGKHGIPNYKEVVKIKWNKFAPKRVHKALALL